MDRLPKKVVVCGRHYPIYTDFRNWIRFELILQSPSLPPAKRMARLLALCYKKLPPTLDGAIRAMLDFYLGGILLDREDNKDESKRPLYSFSHDAQAIYAAFLAQYGLDLQSARLHWWQFKALFGNLNDENRIVKIMQYRSMDLGTISDKEQRKFYCKMKALYRLPDQRSEQQREQDMINGMMALF